MANNQKLKDNYQESIKPFQPKTSYVANCLKAFLVGGIICTLGQAIQNFYIAFFDFNEKNAGNPTVATLILISALLTGFGIYDRIGQFAGAGSAVPVTGFANSMTSAALEHRSEGIVLGVATNMFKLAGNVIVFGTVSAYVVGIIRYLFKTYLL
ncbi:MULTISPECIES: stage V sporulation protein AC [Priestia]|uniref:stage V sporulation protein AC n=1 Tax=Priestia TaxID=2800373 RepID=UPI00211BC1BA|nr:MULTISPECIES: stage V sporulation protein AC [Priestia]MCQ9280192.1 stage V sporulation protein AC [Priestia aryabhattai]MDE8672023.1 stage V sporulation protein AC [Priestia aryabhattai]MED3954568.1 stage V sporulation protein AC [Priestia aryabhattai]MED4388824.1 stage V sporulation protein AC [Priestia aryabhattai]WDC87692.1 stage V sporulation protein AC [Priestia megaterium]